MFVIEKLILKGYRRLNKELGDYFEYTPKEKTQFIIGTNGSGKSSILHELSPLPADASDYHSEGYKCITIRKDGIGYELISRFLPKTKHSFINLETGIDLNPGGTGAVQKDLVSEYFGISPKIHALLLGSSLPNRFSTMSKASRREWLTQLSSVDYTYAIRYYNRLKEKQRDLTGAIKYINGIIADQASKKLNDAQYTHLCDQIKEMSELRQHLLDTKPYLDRTHQQIKDKLVMDIASFESIRLSLVKQQERHLGTLDRDVDGVKHNHAQLELTIASLKQQRLALEDEIHSKTNFLNAVSISDTNAISDKKAKIDEIDKLTYRMINRLNYPTLMSSINDHVHAEQTLKSHSDRLIDLFRQLPVNPLVDDQRTYGDKRMMELESKIQTLKQRYQTLLNASSALEISIAHFNDQLTKDLCVCPSCAHEWVKNFDSAAFERAKKEHADLIPVLVEMRAELDQLTQAFQTCQSYIRVFKDIAQVLKADAQTRPVFTTLAQSNILFDDPTNAHTYLFSVIRDLVLQQEISAKLREREALSKQLEDTQTVTNAVYAVHKTQLEHMSANLHELIAQQNQAVKEKQHYAKLLQLHEKNAQRRESLKQLSIDIAKQSERYQSSMMHLVAQDLIGALDQQIEKLRDLVQANDAVSLSITDNQTALNKLIEEEQVYRQAIAALSPTDGLIAKGLVGFIDCYLSEMNSFIKRIWTYPLTILPCQFSETDKDDLDYRFALESDGKVIEDISMGSSAMREIIDLAFRVVAYQYLGIPDYPLYLDEFGNFFDHAHKKSALNAIINIMIHSNFSQVFIISHDATSYGSIVNSGITVTCDKNVVLPVGVETNLNLTLVEPTT